MCVFVYVWYIHLYMHGCLCDTPISTYGCVYEISWWQWWLVWACNVCQYVTDIMCVFVFVYTMCVRIYLCVSVLHSVYIFTALAPVLACLSQIKQLPVGRGGRRTRGIRASLRRFKNWKSEASREEDLCCWCFLVNRVVMLLTVADWSSRISWELERAEAAECNKMRLPQVEQLSLSLFAILSFCVFICICICNLICNCIET